MYGLTSVSLLASRKLVIRLFTLTAAPAAD